MTNLDDAALVREARAEIQKADEGRGSEPWAVRALLAEIDRLAASAEKADERQAALRTAQQEQQAAYASRDAWQADCEQAEQANTRLQQELREQGEYCDEVERERNEWKRRAENASVDEAHDRAERAEQTNTRLRELVSHYVTRRDLAEIDAALAALADTEQEGA